VVVMAGARLTLTDRRVIERGWRAGWTIPCIAVAVGKDRTTVWREVRAHHAARHGPKHGSPPGRRRGVYRWGYDAGWAQRRAARAARRPRPGRLVVGPLRELVADKLRRRWSPQQISGWLRRTYPHRPDWQVCHETIYQAIYLQSRGGLRREVARALRSGRLARRPAGRAHRGHPGRRPWSSGVLISDRPAEAADRAVPGHWESQCCCQAA
jgi:transposase, IS30 family